MWDIPLIFFLFMECPLNLLYRLGKRIPWAAHTHLRPDAIHRGREDIAAPVFRCGAAVVRSSSYPLRTCQKNPSNSRFFRLGGRRLAHTYSSDPLPKTMPATNDDPREQW